MIPLRPARLTRAGIVLLAVVPIGLLTAVVVRLHDNRNLYSYDEADYAYAVERGLRANYFDEKALSFGAFIESGRSMGGDPSKRSELSETIRSSDDVTFYRHFHGPLYFYWLMLGRWGGLDGEHEMRAMSTTLLGVLALWLFVDAYLFHRLPLAAATFAVLLVFCSRISTEAVVRLTPHGIYVVSAAASLALLSQFIRTGKRAHWSASLVALGLAVASIEYAVLLAVVFIACVVIKRQEALPPGGMTQFVTQSVGILLTTLALVWVGGFTKLSLLKNYIYYVYVAVFRSGAYGSGGFLDVWAHHIGDAPAVTVIACGALIYGIVRARHDPSLVPYVLYAVLAIATGLSNRSIAAKYVSSIFPPLFLIAATAAGDVLKTARGKVITGALVAFVISSVVWRPPIVKTGQRSDERFALALVSNTKDWAPAHSTLLVPRTRLPVLRYYLQQRTLLGYDMRYDSGAALDRMLASRRIDHAIYFGDSRMTFEAVLRQRYLIADSRAVQAGGESIAFYTLRPQ